ncbi:serine--tRNA ligase [Candidatus Micrarchaeota archaeon]|nr:serine--tRNA ligase [Candidatus Micrarchaeota archaeon]
MIHIKVFRENPEIIIESLEKRHDKEKIKWVHQIIEWDQQIRELKQASEKFKAQRNKVSIEINDKIKQGSDVTFLLEEAKQIPIKINKLDAKVEELQGKLNDYQMRIPNILHESVPFGETDEDNPVVKTWGEPRNDEVKSHSDWIIEKNYADLERAAKTSGARFYFLKGKLVELQNALFRYAFDIVKKNGFELISPPYLVRKEVIAGATDLADFQDVVYKIENEDLYLIPTSEHVMLGMYGNETLTKLPIQMAAYSPSFRKEAGSHGKDTKGIFRVHQFNKLEMFIISEPEQSWEMHEKLLSVEEEIMQGLGLPYRVVNICTGDIGIVAAKKYDIEVWMPASQKYRELMSCSNCTAYQSVRSNIRYRKDQEKDWVHTLNATAIVDTRTLVAIIENYIQNDGLVKVPEALKRYVDFETL